MGAVVSRWKANPTMVELLQGIVKDIKDLEECRAKNQRLEKLWVGRLLLYSSVLYLITCISVYFWYLPEQWTGRIVMTLPLFLFPILCLLAVQKYLGAPKSEKMPSIHTFFIHMKSSKHRHRSLNLCVSVSMHPPGPPLASPVLPRDRGAVDRVIEYLVGDGPQNRYALICQQCFSHNGMALKEEFEYIGKIEKHCFLSLPFKHCINLALWCLADRYLFMDPH
eukprot:XP_014035995.1 PREDICTED: protein lunapark-B-like [Salmo salar]